MALKAQIIKNLDNLLIEELKIYGYLIIINSSQNNKKMFESAVKELKVCAVREEYYLDQMTCPLTLFQECVNAFMIKVPPMLHSQYPYINVNLNKQTLKLETDIESIYKRLKNILDIKMKTLVLKNNEKLSYELDTDLDIKQALTLEAVREDININKLKHVNEYIHKSTLENKHLLYYRYVLMQQTKGITDKLLAVNMDIDQLPNLTAEKAAKNLGISLLEYIAHKDFLILQEFSEVVLYLELGLLDIDKVFNQYEKLMLENLLAGLSYESLTKYFNIFNKKYKWTKKKNKKQVLRVIKNVLAKKEVKMKERTQNKSCVAISPENMNNFVALIKLSELIYDKHQLLLKLDIKGEKDSEDYHHHLHELEHYQDFQNEILNKLDLYDEDFMILRPIVENELSIFLKESELTYFDGKQFSFKPLHKKCHDIQERLYNLIPGLDANMKSVAVDSKYAYHIHKNLLVSSLIKEQEDKEKTTEAKLKQLYDESYRYPMLTEEIVMTKFRPNLLPLMDDEVMLNLLNINAPVYYYIKDEELYIMGLKFLTELMENTKINNEHVNYIMANLDIILSSISAENLSDLKEHLNMLKENKLKRKNQERILKLDSLFEKKLPYYLK